MARSRRVARGRQPTLYVEDPTQQDTRAKHRQKIETDPKAPAKRY